MSWRRDPYEGLDDEEIERACWACSRDLDDRIDRAREEAMFDEA